jgi:16S rRNA (guanine527-N7)-methyltransferase
MLFHHIVIVLTFEVLWLSHNTVAFVICNSAQPRTTSQRVLIVRRTEDWRQLQLALKPSRDDVHHNDESLFDELKSGDGPSTSVQFAMDPNDDRAKIVTQRLGMSPFQHQKLADLASLVVECNQRINLVSRRDCTLPVVFGRHVLPSLSLHQVIMTIVETTDGYNGTVKLKQKQESPLRIVDIGTGGGFPGLPLAIALPKAQVLCVDSVGKKIRTVQAMADALRLSNVQTFSGRAEEMITMQQQQQQDEPNRSKEPWKHGFDLVVGRSVTALPNFCSWIQDLITPETGRLLYIIGGIIEDDILSHVLMDVEIDQLLLEKGVSDKRVLVLDAKAVKAIAASVPSEERPNESPPNKRQSNRPHPKNGKQQQQNNARPGQQQRRRGNKGEDSAEPDYTNFQRYTF